ncbi:MAG TPA: AI-2E family transporter [Candidatus Dormibacteraeota bacterium]|nr:AI-2E family transporter [Candidatus Dormibacteraeota bacterium]
MATTTRTPGRARRSGRGAVDVQPETAPAAPADNAQQAAELTTSAWRWIRAAAIALTLFLAWQLLLVVQGWVGALLTIVLFVVFGAVVTFVAQPIVALLERARIPHVPAVLAGLLCVVAAVAGLLYLVAGPLAREVTSLAGQAPALTSDVQQRIAGIQQTLNAHGITVGTGGGLGGLLGAKGASVASHVGEIVIAGVTGVVTVLIDTVIVLVIAFWLLNDGPALRRGFIGMLPGRARDHADFAIDAVRVVIGGYVRAQLFLACVIGVLAWVGCTVIGVPFPIVVGAAAGVFELVPLLGPFLGGAVGVALALTHGPATAVETVVLFVVIHVIEGYILAPRIQARFVRLHPLVAFLSLVAGIEVAGLLGALFAVPVTSLGAVFLRASVGDWRASRPDLFAPQARDAGLEQRRRRLLGQFRLFRRPPVELVVRHGPIGWLRRRFS